MYCDNVFEVLQDEWIHALLSIEARARGGNGEFPLVAGDPAAAKLLRYGGCDAAAAKAIENKILLFR